MSGFQTPVVDIDAEDFDLDAELERMVEEEEEDDEDDDREFELLVVSLCGARMSENVLIGRVETEDEVFAAVIQGSEIANFMVSTGVVKNVDEHAAAHVGALKGVSQLDKIRAEEALNSHEVRIIPFEEASLNAVESVNNLVIDNFHNSDAPSDEAAEFYKWMAKKAVDEDLCDIRARYTEKGLPFLLAVLDVKDDRGIEYQELVGCVGLMNEGDYDPILSDKKENSSSSPAGGATHAELTVLSVQKHYRRHGVGSKLVSAVEEKARVQGFETIVASVFVTGGDGDASRDSHAAMALLLRGNGDAGGGYSVDRQSEVHVGELLGHSRKRRKKAADSVVRYHLRKAL